MNRKVFLQVSGLPGWGGEKEEGDPLDREMREISKCSVTLWSQLSGYYCNHNSLTVNQPASQRQITYDSREYEENYLNILIEVLGNKLLGIYIIAF